MGNSLLRNYDVSKEPHLSGGFRNLWKIYKGSRKDRKQDVSIFVLEKKAIDKYSKDEREEIINILKKEAALLVKFKHPGMLGIVEQLLEDKTTLVFVTEPIQHTLASITESGGISKLEIKLLITELCSVLGFLHDDAKVIHNNLTLDNIFITEKGHIKISGLGYSINDSSINGAEFKFNNSISAAMPSLNTSAPELIYDSKAFYQSDIFSIGIIVHNILKILRGDTDRELLNLNSNTTDSYKKSYEIMENKLSKMGFEKDDCELIIKCLNRKPDLRPLAKQLMELTWFNDPKLKALRFVETLEANDPAKNNEFLAKFPNILGFFDNKIIEKFFLPSFMNAIKIETLIVPTLPALFAVCDNFKIDFEGVVWPGLKVLFQMKQIPAQALYYILSKLNFLAEKISNSEFSSNMLNIICKALDCGVAKIQTVVLDNLTFIIKKIDSLAFKNQIFPRLINIVLNTQSTALKVTILKTWINVYSLLDQNIINENLLNTLEKIRKVDNNSEICVCLVNIYEEIAKVVSIEVN
jgi:SCY1-like protein 2